MSKFHSIYIAVLAAIGITLAGVTGWAAGPNDEVKAAYSAWDAAFQKADAKGIAGFYAEDALFLAPKNEVIRGPAGVQTFFADLFGKGVTAHKLELIEARGAGDMLYATAKWSAMGKDASGKDQPWGGAATHVFQKGSDGKLKIKLHTFN
jgi:uncharacterized protein (TIGR02246 family)